MSALRLRDLISLLATPQTQSEEKTYRNIACSTRFSHHGSFHFGTVLCVEMTFAKDPGKADVKYKFTFYTSHLIENSQDIKTIFLAETSIFRAIISLSVCE